MAALLLAERATSDARMLVLGAGGGLELKAFADWHPQWRFAGVDPSREMLDLARRTLGPLASRVVLHEGYIESAPDGPFDGATWPADPAFRAKKRAAAHFGGTPSEIAAAGSFRRCPSIAFRRPGTRSCFGWTGMPPLRSHPIGMRLRLLVTGYRSFRPKRMKPCSGRRDSPTSVCSMLDLHSGAGSP